MIVGREIVRFASVPSTMDLVAERAEAGSEEGLVILADEQTAGRGRAGRIWVAPPGRSLLCSVLLRPKVKPNRLGVLALLVGVAVARAVESVAPRTCTLKWPNDVLIDGSKVAGILLQSRLNSSGIEFVNVGIGINVDIPVYALEPGATSLRVSGGGRVTRDGLLESLLVTLDDEYASYIAGGGNVSLDPWRHRAVMIGERISVVRDNDKLEGRFVGIDDDGRLLLETDEGLQVGLVQGDVQRGPRISRS